jgi:hypothetical protein
VLAQDERVPARDERAVAADSPTTTAQTGPEEDTEG